MPRSSERRRLDNGVTKRSTAPLFNCRHRLPLAPRLRRGDGEAAILLADLGFVLRLFGINLGNALPDLFEGRLTRDPRLAGMLNRYHRLGMRAVEKLLDRGNPGEVAL